MKRSILILTGLITLGLALACASRNRLERHPDQMGIADDVAERLERFAPVVITTELSELSVGERAVLDELISASRSMNEIFLRQAWGGNVAMRQELEAQRGPNAANASTLFRVMVGPWDRLDETSFIGDHERPEGAGYYPEGMTKEELDAWVALHPDQKQALEGLYHVVRRGPKAAWSLSRIRRLTRASSSRRRATSKPRRARPTMKRSALS